MNFAIKFGSFYRFYIQNIIDLRTTKLSVKLILPSMGAKFYKYEVKVGGRGASVASDPYGGLGGLPPFNFLRGGARPPAPPPVCATVSLSKTGNLL